MAKVTGIKLLHKRYTTADWKNQFLYLGEFGINLTTGEVRGYVKPTQDNRAMVTWDEATPIGIKIDTEVGTSTGEAYKVITGIQIDNTSGAPIYKPVYGDAPATKIVTKAGSTGDFVKSISKDTTDATGFTYTVEYGDLPEAQLDITGDRIEADDGKSITVLKNITGSSDNHKHTITREFVQVATTAYVDSIGVGASERDKDGLLTLPIKGDTSVSDPTTVTTVNEITASKNVLDHNHEIKYDTNTLQAPEAKTAGNAAESNKKLISGVSFEAKDGAYVLTAEQKELLTKVKTSDSNDAKNILTIVDEDNTSITLDLDLSAFATKADISAVSGAMIFKGTKTGTGTLPSGDSVIAGDTYKFVGTLGTWSVASGSKIVLATGAEVTSINPDNGDVVTYSGIDGKWYLIPSGDESDGTVTSIKVGDIKSGLATKGITLRDSNGVSVTEITDAGFIDHAEYGIEGNVEFGSSASTGVNAKLVASTNAENDDSDEVFEFVDGLWEDKDGLGHIVKASKKQVTIPSWTNIENKINELEKQTVVAKGDDGLIEVSPSTNGNVTTYTLTHKDVDTTTAGTKVTAGSNGASVSETVSTNGTQGSITAVTGIYRDAEGHIKYVDTKELKVQDTDTWRPVEARNSDDASGTAFTSGATFESLIANDSNAALKLTGGKNITLEKGDAGEVIIKTLGTATNTTPGFIQGSSVPETEAGNVKRYLHIESDGTGYINVPDTWSNDIHHAGNTIGEHELGFYAVATDARGHIKGLELITTLDGNDNDPANEYPDDIPDIETENRTN